jgi:hypothetical protein
MKELNIVNYTRKTPFNQFCLAHAIFKSFIDAYTDDDGFIYFIVEAYSSTAVNTITVRLRPKVPTNDYIVYEGKLYHGNELYDLCTKVQNEITERAIEELA